LLNNGYNENTATMYGGFASVILVNLIILGFLLQHYVGDFVAIFGPGKWGNDDEQKEIKKEEKTEDKVKKE